MAAICQCLAYLLEREVIKLKSKHFRYALLRPFVFRSNLMSKKLHGSSRPSDNSREQFKEENNSVS